MQIRNEVLRNMYILVIGFVLVAGLLAWKTVKISVIEGSRWRALGDSLYVEFKPIEAERGDVLAFDGRPLATSQPFFEIRMDVLVSSDANFYGYIDSLCYYLARYVDRSRTQAEIKARLVSKREGGKKAGAQYVLISPEVSYNLLEKIKKFPLFRLGRYKGGLIVEKRSKRYLPFQMLASRTIGYVKPGAKPVGLEGYYDKVLKGAEGKRLMQKLSSNMWVPVKDLAEITPQRGMDILTTIDIDLQDIAESRLLEAVQYHQAEGGCAIIMETKTGALRAIANLDKASGGYWELYNHAIGTENEPGSTFKLATVMAMLEDDLVDLDTKVDLEGGSTRFYDLLMEDSRNHGLRSTSLKQAFAISSNVGIAKLANRVYVETRNEEQFISRLKQFGLASRTGIEVHGEPSPYIKDAYDYSEGWSGTTVPWMAHGYELKLTPLQLLTFYNAVANDGVLVKPYLIEAIKDVDKTVQSFQPRIINPAIASERTIRLARQLLNEVVESGTAAHLKLDQITFAGKSGTTRLDYFVNGDSREYQATFIGFFPAEDPVYSCLIIIYRPQEHGYYGGQVAGPVFRDIVKESFSIKPQLYAKITHTDVDLARLPFPPYHVGYKRDIGLIFNEFGLPVDERTDSEWIVVMPEKQEPTFQRREISREVIPNVRGMGLRDAVFLLESRGLQVVFRGLGKVQVQYPAPGQPLKGQRVELECG